MVLEEKIKNRKNIFKMKVDVNRNFTTYLNKLLKFNN